ncbi:MAG TPA: Clp protease N-terminal domain-containing protein [Ktedonobacteraceae bacterium]|nr:Clp protease N-terminal domain-containing protein [Ktedonobacteraceae bacterium]
MTYSYRSRKPRRIGQSMREVLSFANEEAAVLEHNYIGTEHLLLGLANDGGGVAAMALIRSGLNLKDVRQRIMDIIEKGSHHSGYATMYMRGALFIVVAILNIWVSQ